MIGTKRSLAVAAAALAVLTLAPTATATMPGHNGLLAFQAQTDDGIQLFTMRPNGHILRQITHIAGDATAPDWSPDGTRLVFGVDEFEATESACVIATSDRDGNHLVRIQTDPTGLTPGVNVCQGDASWMPDGEHLLVGRYDPGLDEEAAWTVRADGTGWVRLPLAGAVELNSSPDGTHIAFKGENGALFVQRIDGSGLVRVSPDINVAFKADWAPDGQQLVFSDYAQPDGQPVNVWTVRPDGTGLTRITDFVEPRFRAYVGSYSPDGQWIVFRLEDADSFALFRIRPDGTDLHRITAWSGFKPRGTDWGSAKH